MELELGLKITKTKDDIDSISEYQFMKDAGPVFHSRETNSMFILTANLKGYKRNNIDIMISKDGSKISISGKKPIQEMVMMGWVMQRKVVDVKGFNKIFKIPNGVNLDKIKGNYNEEEWRLNIVMPKLVKGICGLKIEEFKEQDKGEIDHVSSSVGETSQKGSKDCEFQHIEGGENVIEKMLDDTNKITTQKEVRGSKLRIEDGNNEVNKNIRENEKCRIEDSKIKDIRENDGKEIYEALKTLENMEKMPNETNKDRNEETIEKEIRDSKLRIENGNRESEREKGGKEEYEVTKKSERDQRIGVFISNKFEDTSKDKEFEHQKMDNESDNKRHEDVNRDIFGEIIKEEKKESNLKSEESKVKDIGKGNSGKEEFEVTKKSKRDQGVGVLISNKFEDTRKDKEFEDQKMDSRSANKRHDDDNRDIIGGTIKEEEKDESNVRSKDSKVKDIDKGISHNIVDTSQRVFEESMIQQSGESKQKDSKEHFGESEKENSMVIFEAMKVLEVEENVVGYIPNNIGCINQNEFEESRIPEMEKIKVTKKKMDGGEYEKLPFKANQDFQKEMIKPKMKTKDGDQERVLEKLSAKEGFNDEMVIIKKELPKHLPRSTSKERGGLNVEEMQETKNVKEEMVSKEVEYFVEKVEGERFKRMHVKAKKGNNTKETTREEIGESENGLKENCKEQFAGIEGSKEINFENNDEQKEVIKEALVENEILIVEGGEYKERTKEVRQDVEDTFEYGIVKLKGEGSIKMGENEVKEIGHEKFLGIERSKGFNFATEEEKNEVINDTLVEDESLIMERGENKEKTKGIFQDEEDKNKHGIVKLKGEGSTNIHGEPNEPFEVDNANNRIFDGRKTHKFQEIEQIEDEDVNEEGANIRKSMKKVNRERNEKVQNEENEGFHKKTSKKKDERFLQEMTSKGISIANNDAKEVFPMKILDSPIDTREGPKNTRIEKIKGVKESSMEPFEKSENGIKGGGQQQSAEIKGSKGFNVAKEEEEEEESKKRSKSKEQYEKSISHTIIDSGQRVFEEPLIQQSRESKQKEIGGSKCDSKERLKEFFKESSMEQNVVDNIHSKIGCINQNEFREPRVPQMEKTRSTKGKKNGGMDFEKTSFKVNEDVQKVVFGDAIQPKNSPKRSFDEIEGLNVQKFQELKNVEEEMVDKEIEYFEEKSVGERFKRMYVETKKGNKREKMQEEIEKSENEFKEIGKQHAKENTIKEMDEVSKNVTSELKQKVSEINESKGLNVAKEEEKKEVTKNVLVESECLMQHVEGKESKERTKAKRVQDEDDKIEFGIVKLKGQKPTKIHAVGRSFREKEEIKDVNEKGEKTEKFGQKVNNKMKNQEDEDFNKGVTKEKDEFYFPEDVSERRSQDSKDAQEDFPMEMLEPKIDKREEKCLKENEKGLPFVNKVKFEEEFKDRTKTIVQDEGDKTKYGTIVRLKADRSTKISHKFQEKEKIEDTNEKGEKNEEFVKKVSAKIQNKEDEGFKKNTTKEKDECFFQEISEGRSKANKAANEPFEDRIQRANSNQTLDPIDEFIEKENFGIAVVDGRKIQKFQEMNQTQDAKKKGANNEKTKKKVSGNKHEIIQNEEIEGLRNDIDGRSFGESMTNEELQEFEMEKIRNHEREFQSIVSIGFKEFDYENTKDKKQKTKVLDKTFESKERYESKDESMNQEVFSPKNQKEVGENCTRNELCTNEVETMEDQVINPISVPRFQSEVEEKDKSCEGNKAKCKGYREPKKDDPTQDVENFIEMKEKEEKKGEKGEFHNGEKVWETIQEKTDEPEKKNDYREQETAARDDGKVETKKNDRFKEHKTTHNVNDEKKKIHETIETTRKKELSVKFEVDEKEEESLVESLKNDIAEMKTKKDHEQHEYGIEDIKAPKTAAYEGAKQSKLQRKKSNQQPKDEINIQSECVTEEHEATKEFSPNLNIVERKKIEVEPNMNNEISKVKEVPKAKEEERHIHVPVATILKEEGTQVTTTHSKERQRVEPKGEVDKLQENQIPSPKQPFHSIDGLKPIEVLVNKVAQLFELEGKAKAKKKESKMDIQDSTKSKTCQVVGQCINKDEQARHGIDEQKEAKDDTNGGKKENAKISETIEEEKNLKKREEQKVAKSEEEKKPKMKEPTPQFDLASGSKRVAEKVHEYEKKSKESTSKFEVEPLKEDNEIPKVEELGKEEAQKNNHVLEETISKEDEAQAKATPAEEKVAQQSKIPSSLCTQQLEVEGEEKTKKNKSKMTCQEDEQCINKEQEAKLGIEETEEDEACGGKKENAKISKKMLVPLLIAGSTLLATIVFIFVRHRRSRKR